MDDSLKSIFRPVVEMDDEAPSEPPPRFRLTSSNLWYLVVVAAGYALAEASKREELFIGAPYVIGLVIGSLLFSSLVAWIAFRLSSRSVLVGSVAFNGFLTLIAFGQFYVFFGPSLLPQGRVAESNVQERGMAEISRMNEEFKRKLSETDDPARVRQITDDHARAVDARFSRMAEASTDPLEKQYLKIIADHVADRMRQSREWQASLAALNANPYLEVGKLPTRESLKRSRTAAKSYLAYSKQWRTSCTDHTEIKRRFAALRDPTRRAARFLEGFLEGQDKELKSLLSTLDVHIAYADTVLELGDLLEANLETLQLVDGHFAFASSEELDKFNALIVKADRQETEINALAEKTRKGS